MSPPSYDNDHSMGRSKAPRRAKVACKACNARRVRCDVVQSHPCWHCRTRETPCEIMESRRGKYERTQRHRRPTKACGLQDRSIRVSTKSLRPNSDACDEDEDEIPGENHEHHEPAVMVMDTSPVQVFTPDPDEVEEIPKHSQGPDTLFANMADPEATSPDSTQGIGQEPSTLYLGEAFNLTFVVKTVCSPSSGPSATEPVKVHYPVPILSREPHTNEHDVRSFLENDVVALLEARGALGVPVQEVGDALVSVFFGSIHPAFPVFDRKDFERRYRRGNMSLLVLQTIYFLAVTICDKELLLKAGFQNRDQARRTFYMRAKLLYDADYERDKTLLAACLQLLSFWWQKPQDQKDSWHWIGCAISLAQALGMHRTTVNSCLQPRTRSLWKRIWWSIYVRDRQAAAALGRPCRIRDEDCDVELLTEEDFMVDSDTTLPILGTQADYHVSYAIHMSKLAVLVGQVQALKFSPKVQPDKSAIAIVGDQLSRWEHNLPHQMMRRPLRRDLDAAFWAANLHGCYHNTEILLYRPTSIDAGTEREHGSLERAMYASDATTRIAEDLLTAGTLRVSQIHLIPALFAALSIHAIVIRQSDKIRKKLAENRARQCMLALSELSMSWPVGGWILYLFQTLIARLTSQTLRHGTQQPSDSLKAQSLAATPMSSDARQITTEIPSTESVMSNQWYLGQLLPNDSFDAVASQSNSGYDTLYDFDLFFQHSLENFAPLGFVDENMGLS